MLETVFFEIFLKELCKKKKFRGIISFVLILWLLKQMFVFVLDFFWSFTDKISGSGERERFFSRNSCGRRLPVNSLKKVNTKTSKEFISHKVLLRLFKKN